MSNNMTLIVAGILSLIVLMALLAWNQYNSVSSEVRKLSDQKRNEKAIQAIRIDSTKSLLKQVDIKKPLAALKAEFLLRQVSWVPPEKDPLRPAYDFLVQSQKS